MQLMEVSFNIHVSCCMHQLEEKDVFYLKLCMHTHNIHVNSTVSQIFRFLSILCQKNGQHLLFEKIIFCIYM